MPLVWTISKRLKNWHPFEKNSLVCKIIPVWKISFRFRRFLHVWKMSTQLKKITHLEIFRPFGKCPLVFTYVWKKYTCLKNFHSFRKIQSFEIVHSFGKFLHVRKMSTCLENFLPFEKFSGVWKISTRFENFYLFGKFSPVWKMFTGLDNFHRIRKHGRDGSMVL